MRITFEMDDLTGSFTEEGGQWRLVAKDKFEGTTDEKIVTTKEMAAILLCMHDEFSEENIGEVFSIASETLKSFKVAILP